MTERSVGNAVWRGRDSNHPDKTTCNVFGQRRTVFATLVGGAPMYMCPVEDCKRSFETNKGLQRHCRADHTLQSSPSLDESAAMDVDGESAGAGAGGGGGLEEEGARFETSRHSGTGPMEESYVIVDPPAHHDPSRTGAYAVHTMYRRERGSCLLGNESLDKARFAVNSSLCVVVCTRCCHVVAPVAVERHLRAVHGLRKKEVEGLGAWLEDALQLLQQARAGLEGGEGTTLRDKVDLGLLQSFQPTPEEREPEEGFAVHAGWKCRACGFVSCSAGGLHRHQDEEDACTDSREAGPELVYYQVFSKEPQENAKYQVSAWRREW